MTPEEFEKRIARIHEVLEQPGTKVTWNDHIPDPDNPEQPRQVDITIIRKGRVTHVECRHHKTPQDVQWVEELYGRKASLRARSIMGVSSSGFTEGAIKKAERLGVILRDFRTVTDEEVRDWGQSTRVWLYYIKFGKTTLFPVLSRLEIRRIRPPVKFHKSDWTTWPLNEMMSEMASRLNESSLPQGGIRVQFFTRDLFINGIPIGEVIVETKWSKVKVAAEPPVVYVYGAPPRMEQPQHSVLIEEFSGTEFEIYRSPTEVIPIFDFSIVKPIPGGIFREMIIDFGKEISSRRFEIVGPKESHITPVPFNIHPVLEDSREYMELLNATIGLVFSLPSPEPSKGEPRLVQFSTRQQCKKT